MKSLYETFGNEVDYEIRKSKIVKFLEDRGYDMINNKSKRLFIFAPTTGINTPNKKAFGRRPGPGPYITLLPEDKQEIAKQRHGY